MAAYSVSFPVRTAPNCLFTNLPQSFANLYWFYYYNAVHRLSYFLIYLLFVCIVWFFFYSQSFLPNKLNELAHQWLHKNVYDFILWATPRLPELLTNVNTCIHIQNALFLNISFFHLINYLSIHFCFMFSSTKYIPSNTAILFAYIWRLNDPTVVALVACAKMQHTIYWAKVSRS